MPVPPKFSQLPLVGQTGERHTWDVFGRGDQLGTINLLTPERVKRAATLVRTGKVINLNLPLNFPITLYGGFRSGYRHHIEVNRGGRDDYVDNFAMQGSSQWDSLRHIRFREFGYYGGRQDTDLDGKGELGIENWARHGIIGRGVLLDAAGYLGRRGTPLDATKRFAMDGAFLEEVAQAENVRIEPGDIVLLRTGWLTWYKGLDEAGREALRGTLHPGEGGMACPGLDPSQATAGWVWDQQIAAMAADNVALEALPVAAAVGFQHRRLIALQGMPIGEVWDLDELAQDCARDRVYECMLVSAPLNLPGGVGSPPNAYAIK
ncbi:MAG TPA: cyclase family protein [Candidatus Binatia bacterium]|jgi:kynurenine formamidase|nr:cyclase family protein [Candidatus Binatia bacterium]